MPLSRAHRRLTAWLALLAMVFGALAPALVQAVVPSSDRADWVQICSVSGMVWVQADTVEQKADGSDPAPMGMATPHCAWCSLHGGAAALAPAVDASEPLAPQADLPPVFSGTVSPSGVWAPPQARAPPLSA